MEHNETSDACRVGAEKAPVFKFRLVASIARNSGLGYAAGVFLALFVACSAFVAVVEPQVKSFFDAVWVCFQAVTTIGFGDIAIVTVPGRIATMIVSVFGVLFVAVLTGAVVSYCSERTKMQHNESLLHFANQLEHLPELSREELADLSRRVSAFLDKR